MTFHAAGCSLVLATIAASMASCTVESSWTTCASGRVCPVGQTCDETNDTCSSSNDPCHEKPDGEMCGLGGICRRGECINRCGNNVLDDGEECDGEDFGGATCADRGWYFGRLNCNSSCQIREDRCNGFCGDGWVDGAYELCEPSPSEGGLPSCVSQGYDAGKPGCQSTCDGWADRCLSFGWTQRDIPGGDLIDMGSAGGALFALTSSGGVLSEARGWATVGGDAGRAVTGRALWANSPRDIWVINSTGNGFLHWNGNRWKEVPIQREGLRDIWGSSSSDVFAVGDRGIIFHFDGEVWENQRCSPDGPEVLCRDLLAVWGIGPDQVYAGGVPTTFEGSILHYDGTEWSLPFGPAEETVTGLWAHRVLGTPDGSSAARIWSITPTTVHRGWTEMLRVSEPSEGMAAVAGGGAVPSGGWIVGTGPSDVWWSAGVDGSLRHYDGRRWSTMVPGTSRGAQPIGIGREAVVVADPGGGEGVGRIRQWSGAGNGALLSSSGIWADAWTFDPEPDPSFWLDASTPQPDLWIAVGRDPDTGQGLALHSDGRMFRFDAPLAHVAGFSQDFAYAASDRQILQWDGQAWSVLRSGNGLRVADLWTARSSGQADLYAIDRNTATGPRVLRFDGRRWYELPAIDLYCDFDLKSGWASGRDNVFVVGQNAAAHFDGSRWWEITFCSGNFESVWGSRSGDVWYSQSVSESGQTVLHHWFGGSGDDTTLNGSGRLVGTASDDIFFGSSAYFDGNTWSPIQTAAMAGTPVIALPSRLLTVGAVDGTVGLGQFIRTRFWNDRSSEVYPLVGSDADCSDGVDNDDNGVVDRGDSRCAPPP